ncbi:hypothetical protein K2P97_12070 [bacterium]|nr:hypothetical protein [bacterium]
MKKYSKKWWFFLATIFPLLWLLMFIVYLGSDGCFSKPGYGIICGGQALLILVIHFLFFMSFPYFYIIEIRPKIKEQEFLEKVHKDLKIIESESEK